MKAFLTAVLSVIVYAAVFTLAAIAATPALEYLMKVPGVSQIRNIQYGYTALEYVFQILPIIIAAGITVRVPGWLLRPNDAAKAAKLTGGILLVLLGILLVNNIRLGTFRVINLIEMLSALYIFRN